MLSRVLFASTILLGTAGLAAIAACSNPASSAPAADDGGPEASAPIRPKRPTGDGGDTADPEGGPTWCSTQGQHSFCADFDSVDDALAGWTGLDTTGGFPKFDLAASDRSAPNAVSVTQAAASPGGGSHANGYWLSKTIDFASPKGLHLALDMQIAANGLDGDTYALAPIMIALTRQDGMSTSYAFAAQLDVRSTKAGLHLYGSDPDGGAFGPEGGGDIEAIPVGTWVHVDLALETTSTGGTATLSLDGKPADTFDITGILTTGLNGAALEIGARMPQFAPRDSILEFDNIVLDVK